MLALQPGLMDAPGAAPFVALVAVLYARMVGGEPAMDVLRAVVEGAGGEGEVALAVGEIAGVVKEEVDKVCVLCCNYECVCVVWVIGPVVD